MGSSRKCSCNRGINTYAIGKWHLTPADQISAAGPYDRWPLGRGFERFYGFLGGETHQYYPELVYDNHQVEPPNPFNPRSISHRHGEKLGVWLVAAQAQV
jgi:arylsulfatase A-like enzyme